MERDLRTGVWQGGVGIRSDQQENLRAESPRADSRDIDEELVALESQRADDPRWQRVGSQAPSGKRRARFRAVGTSSPSRR
jgi:hypothetical protein